MTWSCRHTARPLSRLEDVHDPSPHHRRRARRGAHRGDRGAGLRAVLWCRVRSHQLRERVAAIRATAAAIDPAHHHVSANSHAVPAPTPAIAAAAGEYGGALQEPGLAVAAVHGTE